VSANRQAIIEMDVGFAQIRDAAIDRCYSVRRASSSESRSENGS